VIEETVIDGKVNQVEVRATLEKKPGMMEEMKMILKK
jgi:hypothetical protein